MMSLNAIGIFLFFGAGALALFALGDFALERRQVFKSLRSVRAIELGAGQIRQRELSLPFLQRVLVPAIRRAGRLGSKLTPASVVERLNRELAYAGNPAAWDAERVLAFKVLAAPIFAAGALMLGLILHLTLLQLVLVAALFGFAGYYLPEWMVRIRAAQRQDIIRRTLPDALDLLSITVEAGLGFDAAVDRVSRQAGGPLGEELHRVVQEIQIGKSRSEALRDLGERSSVPELKSFVLAMIQADVFGVSIAKVLHVQAKEMRIKRRQRAEERAQKIPVKIVFPLIFCIFPSLFVVLLGPAAIRIYENLIKQ
jgi:tight adherence protein C